MASLRTYFEGLGLEGQVLVPEALGPWKLACPRLKDSTFSELLKFCGAPEKFFGRRFFLEIARKIFVKTFFGGGSLKTFFFEDFIFFGRALARLCPWPREGLSLEGLFLALASDFFCVLGLEPLSLTLSLQVTGSYFAWTNHELLRIRSCASSFTINCTGNTLGLYCVRVSGNGTRAEQMQLVWKSLSIRYHSMALASVSTEHLSSDDESMIDRSRNCVIRIAYTSIFISTRILWIHTLNLTSAGMTVNDRTQLSGEHLEAVNVLHCNHELLNGWWMNQLTCDL